MANAVATPSVGVSINSVENTQKSIIVRGSIAVGASPLVYVTGGIVLDLSPLAAYAPLDKAPLYLMAWSQPAVGSPNTGLYLYGFLPGSTLSTGKFQVFTGAAAQSAPAELSAGAVPAGVSGDTIVFEAVFAR